MPWICACLYAHTRMAFHEDPTPQPAQSLALHEILLPIKVRTRDRDSCSLTLKLRHQAIENRRGEYFTRTDIQKLPDESRHMSAP